MYTLSRQLQRLGRLHLLLSLLKLRLQRNTRTIRARRNQPNSELDRLRGRQRRNASSCRRRGRGMVDLVDLRVRPPRIFLVVFVAPALHPMRSGRFAFGRLWSRGSTGTGSWSGSRQRCDRRLGRSACARRHRMRRQGNGIAHDRVTIGFDLEFLASSRYRRQCGRRRGSRR